MSKKREIEMQNHNLNTALQYAQRGLAVFPVREMDKTPLTKNGCKDAIKDADIIRRWWGQLPNANIGMATGQASGLWVLDIDGDEGAESLRALEATYGDLPPTMEVLTGGGGRHLYFSLPKGLEMPNSAGKVGPKIDVRGNGGYVVAPPSVHKSGRKYVWSVDSLDTPVDAPVWLQNLAVGKPRPSSERRDVDWEAILRGVTEGSRNDCVAKLSGKLLAHGLEPEFSFYLLAAWNDARCTPPLPNEELLKTFVSIAQRNFKNKVGV